MLTYFEIEDLIYALWDDHKYSSNLNDTRNHSNFKYLLDANEYDRRTIKLFLIYNLMYCNVGWAEVMLAGSMFNDFDKNPQPEDINGDFEGMKEFYLTSLLASEV